MKKLFRYISQSSLFKALNSHLSNNVFLYFMVSLILFSSFFSWQSRKVEEYRIECSDLATNQDFQLLRVELLRIRLLINSLSTDLINETTEKKQTSDTSSITNDHSEITEEKVRITMDKVKKSILDNSIATDTICNRNKNIQLEADFDSELLLMIISIFGLIIGYKADRKTK